MKTYTIVLFMFYFDRKFSNFVLSNSNNNPQVANHLIKSHWQKHSTVYLIAAILLLSFLIYLPSISNGFLIWDDDQNVYQNPYITSLNINNIKHFFTTFTIGMYQPLTSLSFAINYQISGMNPAGFHTGNILLHLSNTILIYFFIRILTLNTKTSLLTALFFGIHPMFVESVAWVSERKDVLYTFFFLLSIISYIKYIRTNKKLKWLILTFILFCFSVLSKTTAVVLPFVLFLTDYILNRKNNIRLWVEKIPFFAITVIFGIIALKSQYSAHFIEQDAWQYSITDRLFLSGYALSFYLSMFIIPLKLSVIHPYPLKSSYFLPLNYYLATILIVLLIIGLYKLIHRQQTEVKKEITFGLLFFLIMIMLFIQWLPIPGLSVVSERYAYLAYTGLFFIISSIITRFFEYKKAELRKIPILFLTLILIFIAFYSVSTYKRNLVWRSNITLFTDAIEKHPETAMPYNNRGLAYQYAGFTEKAVSDLSKAVQIRPKVATYHYNLGNIYLSKKDYPQAIKHYTNAISLKPDRAEAYYINRGIAYHRSGNNIAAFWDLSNAIKFNGPLASVAYFNRAAARVGLNDDKGACSDWQLAFDLGYKEAQQQLQQYCK